MRHTDWRAFVRFREEPVEKPEWTWEMDWEIATATHDWELSYAGKLPSAGAKPLKIPVASYSTDLAAIVRATEKWCRDKCFEVEIETKDYGVTGWVACLKRYHPFPTREFVESAPSLALALAKALYAAIRWVHGTDWGRG